jgi:hypothetical protein
MEFSTFYIALVFLVPVVLAFILLIALAIDSDWAQPVVAKPKTTSTAKRKVVINPVKGELAEFKNR